MLRRARGNSAVGIALELLPVSFLAALRQLLLRVGLVLPQVVDQALPRNLVNGEEELVFSGLCVTGGGTVALVRHAIEYVGLQLIVEVDYQIFVDEDAGRGKCIDGAEQA